MRTIVLAATLVLGASSAAVAQDDKPSLTQRSGGAVGGALGASAAGAAGGPVAGALGSVVGGAVGETTGKVVNKMWPWNWGKGKKPPSPPPPREEAVAAADAARPASDEVRPRLPDPLGADAPADRDAMAETPPLEPDGVRP